MRQVTGTLQSRAKADQAIRALQQAGIAPGDITRDDEDAAGGTLVTALVDEGQEEVAASILNQAGSVEIDESAKETEISSTDDSDPRSYRREDDPDAFTIIPPLPR